MTNLKQQLANFLLKGKITNKEGKQNDCFNFYDWFCKDSSLKNKAIALFKKVDKFMKSKAGSKLNYESVYVFFKNNCPMNGSLYDDFRICDAKTGDIIFTVIPRSGHTSANGAAQLWGKENNFKEPLEIGSWNDILNFESTL